MLALSGTWAIVITALLAYALGLVMGGMVMTALKGGADLRNTGSGNVGATNALRTRGKGFAAGVLLIDVAKGVIAVWVLPRLITDEATLQSLLAYVAGAAVTVGHCYPAPYGFRGGKGLATLTAGALAVLHVACFDAAGLGSARGAFVSAMVVLVVWKHRSNLRNLVAGRESRFENARIVHRLFRRP